jgi:hypothetical protein
MMSRALETYFGPKHSKDGFDRCSTALQRVSFPFAGEPPKVLICWIRSVTLSREEPGSGLWDIPYLTLWVIY